MRIHVLEHETYEGCGNIANWAQKRCHTLTKTALYANESLPSLEDFDMLVIMGGPMNIYEEDKYPWLALEKQLIREALADQNKVLLGICLGGQLIADCLGGKVTRNPEPEIGWFPVALTEAGKQSWLFKGLTHQFIAFHWHGDTFALPPGALHLAGSDGCPNQAFVWENRAVGLQFHPEISHKLLDAFLTEGNTNLPEGQYVQSPLDMSTFAEFYLWELRDTLNVLMDNLEKHCLVGT